MPPRDVRDTPYRPRAASPAVLTTTIFAGGAPTATQPPSPSMPTPIPIGAIVGGLATGAFLALAAVGAWICWGRSLERKQRKQPRIRSAIKQQGRSLPGAGASKHSPPRTYSSSNPMVTLSQKSVTFAPSPRTSEDSDPPTTPSPTGEPEPPSVGKRKQNPHANREANTPSPPPPPPPPRSALRPSPSQRLQGPERAYAPSRPSPLAQALHASPSTRSSSLDSASQADSTQLPSAQRPPLLSRHVSAHRSSVVSSTHSEYSQEGTASEGGELAFKTAHVRGGTDGRLYAHPESEEVEGSKPHPRLGGPPTSTGIR